MDAFNESDGYRQQTVELLEGTANHSGLGARGTVGHLGLIPEYLLSSGLSIRQ